MSGRCDGGERHAAGDFGWTYGRVKCRGGDLGCIGIYLVGLAMLCNALIGDLLGSGDGRATLFDCTELPQNSNIVGYRF
mgnify:CR=1 FL=1